MDNYVGCLAIGHRKRWGFLLSGAGNVAWGYADLWVISLIFVFVALYNWRQWAAVPQECSNCQEGRVR